MLVPVACIEIDQLYIGSILGLVVVEVLDLCDGSKGGVGILGIPSKLLCR